MSVLHGIIKYRRLVLIFFIGLTAFCIPGLLRLKITTDISDYFIDSDVILHSQELFGQLFQSGDFIAVYVESGDVFSAETLEVIHNTGTLLSEQVPFAAQLVSLTEINPVFGGGLSFEFQDGTLQNTADEVEQIKNQYLRFKTIKNRIFSDDFQEAWIVLQLEKYPPPEEWSRDQTPQLYAGEEAYKIVQSVSLPDGIRLTATGLPVYAHRKEAEMMRDFFKIVLFGMIAAIILSLLILREVQAVCGTLCVIFISVIAIFGIYGWTGVKTDSAFMAVPVLLTIGVSIGYTVHIFRFFRLRFSGTGQRKVSVLHALKETWRPVFFTVITTIAALISFLFVRLEPVRWVGITSAFSVLSVYILCMTFFPSFLSYGKDRPPSDTKVTPVFEQILKNLSDFIAKKQRLVIILFLLISALSFYSLTLLEVDFSAETMMGNRLPHMKEQIRVGESLIGSNDFINLTIQLRENDLTDPEILNQMNILQSRISTLPLVKNVSSVTDSVYDFNLLFSRGREQSDIPQSPAQIWALYSMLPNDILHSWVSEDHSSARILIEMSGFSSKIIEENIEQITEFSKDILPVGASVFMSGSSYMTALMNQYVTRGLIRSVLTGLALITILMIFVFKSIRLGLIAMIPNVFPILVCGAIMGFAGIRLEFVTMTVAPLIMGLAVDDTIHFISFIKKSMLKMHDCKATADYSFSMVGTAITETTVILCLTFLVFTVSDVTSLKYMGILTCSGMLAAWAADIFVTPVLVCRSNFLKRSISLKQ